jgi:hypothetical protein
LKTLHSGGFIVLKKNFLFLRKLPVYLLVFGTLLPCPENATTVDLTPSRQTSEIGLFAFPLSVGLMIEQWFPVYVNKQIFSSVMVVQKSSSDPSIVLVKPTMLYRSQLLVDVSKL